MIDGPRPYVGRLALTAGLVATGLILIFTIGTHGDVEDSENSAAKGAKPEQVRERRPQPHASVPRAAVDAPVDRPNKSDQLELERWSDDVARQTGIPARVVSAYGRAEQWMRIELPRCHLSWGTLAGIGRVESRHGTLDGNRIRDNGMPRTPIYGVPLDGSRGLRELPDADNGKFDGDRKWERAVGPMQFLPATWGRFGGRAVRDGGRPDPQNIDDSALAAGRYLCSDGRDLATRRDWWDGVLAYNADTRYAQDVYSGAAAYADDTAPRR